MLKNVYENRELSWLKFNERVLQESRDENVPLLERLIFVSIFQTNLDEFFMVRVGSLFDQVLLDDKQSENKTNMTAKEQLNAIFERVKQLEPVKDRAYKLIMKKLKLHGIEHVDINQISDIEEKFLENYFVKEVMPLLSPLIIDKRHPMPFLKNKDIYAVVHLESKSSVKLGILPVTDNLKRIIKLSNDSLKFVLIEELILKYANKVFKNYKVLDKFLMRITRNADISEEDDSLLDSEFDFRDMMEELVKKRKKLSPIRLQIYGDCINQISINHLSKKLELAENQIFKTEIPLDVSYVFAFKENELYSHLCFNKLVSQKTTSIREDESIINQVKKKDILLHYPYETIKHFLKFLDEVSNDKNVISVKITLYRLARNSQIIQSLINMAENGINVLVLVELRARFDEENNINWSKRLQKAGCNILYGPIGLKVHSKLLLVTRKVNDEVEYITQVGTGNYNEKTSELYTDLSLLTANKKIAMEAAEVFNALSIEQLVENSSHLLVAPKSLQNKIINFIDDEIEAVKQGIPAYIGIKINSLSDKIIIDKLIEASQAGVKINLIIRGICCIISKVPEFTENITVTSIVGRFLEHSRIYIFGKDERTKIFISSADFMTRNTVRRVEVAVPVYDEDIKARLLDIFNTMLNDNVKARVQYSDGSYRRKYNKKAKLDSQVYFYKQAYEKAKEIPKINMKNEVLTTEKDYAVNEFYKVFLKQ